MSASKRVWILGAGFSRSLGGPLLTRLLTRPSVHRVTTAYAPDFSDYMAMVPVVASVYAEGSDLSRNPFEVQWDHAEAFLERLDLAVAGQDAHERGNLAGYLQRLAPYLIEREAGGGVPNPVGHVLGGIATDEGKLEQFYSVALKILCAECSVFLQSAHVEHEAWTPYVRWANELDDNDAILTFNYDGVPDFLRDNNAPLWIPDPSQIDDKLARQSAAADQHATVLKLHGSLAWIRKEDGGKQVMVRAEAGAKDILRRSRSQLAIAVPGPSKRLAVTDGPLKPLWKEAQRRIREADQVYFVGYRIPPSDALTRAWLLKALTQGLNEHPHRTVSIVLGENTAHPDVARVQQLLTHVLGNDKVRTLALRAEDFLDALSIAK